MQLAWGRYIFTVHKRTRIVVDFCCPRQARWKTSLAVVCVLAGMADTLTM